ncbi:hypothetical protein RHMOL_Rhmol05G0183500 [Rhododendron molle]|uniref:Uncharacterized protein n=1 Tax=Rhododendron molle TaxID=49168 RepID=A0ACC0NQV6_RHOML|nr:hypothetical protein RHMOL_Rhmol05G0183500 [Rhododendron molle]
MFLALSTIPNLSQVSYIGLDGLMFSFYNDEDQTLAVFSNNSFSSTYYTQPVNRDTGKLYGAAISSKFMSKFNTSWYQNFSNLRTGHTSFGIGWNKAQDLLFSCTAAMDGRGVISIGVPVNALTDFFTGIDFLGGDFHLAANDGHILVETKLPDTKIFVQNGTVSLYGKNMEGVITNRNKSCKLFEGEGCHFNAKIRGIKHVFYCSPVEIAGVPSVYVLSFPTKGLESLVHEKSILALTLLVLMFVVVLISLCIFMTLIIRAARREMFLCAALIKQMEATQQAERKSMNKSRAFATASHDIRSCLAGITGWIDPCLEQATPHSNLVNNLILMKTCAADLHGILNSVLDISKIEAGKMQLEEEEFDLIKLLEDVVDMYYPDGMNKGVDVVLDPCDGSIFKFCLVKGDRGKLKQILCNLIHNAIKFTSEGHVSVRAIVKKPSKEDAIIASNRNGILKCFSRLCDRNNGSFNGLEEIQTIRQNPNCMEFVFEVDDTGRGVPKENQKSVFENFVQVKESPHRREGCGLGLGIVQSLVRLMGGEIKIMDKEHGERGTCFRFNIFLAVNLQDSEDCNTSGRISIDFHHKLGLHRWSPTPKSEGSHVVLLITGEERRKISKKFIENLGIKVSIAKQEREICQLLQRLKHKLDCSRFNSLEKNELCMLDYLSKSASSNSNSAGIDGFSGIHDPSSRKSNSKHLPTFILIVVDACAGPFSKLNSMVANLKKETQNIQCKVVWLDNPFIRAKSPEKNRPSLPCDHTLSKPFHGSSIRRVLGLLPEYGGIYQCNSPISTEATQEMQRSVHSSTMSESTLSGKRVLVVEDVEILCKLATTSLRKLGAIVDVCVNGKEAFDRVCKVLGDQWREGQSQALPYDYIFMDCEMPIMNGYEATKLIRMEEQHYDIHIPIIALTAHAMAEDASKTMRAGMDFHLTKPLREDTLLDTIRCIEMK